MFLNTPFAHSAARGLQIALGVAIAYTAAMETTGLIHPNSAPFGALWAAISSIVVLQPELAATASAARLRFWGTVVGAAIAGGYLMIFPFSPAGLALCVGIAVTCAHLLNQNDGGRLAAITVTVIMLLGAMNPGQHPMVSAGLRLFEACLGAAAAILVTWSWVRIKAAFRRGRGA